MGNLGLYLWLTKIAKRVGGPIAFVLIMIAGGVALGLGMEAAIKRIVMAVRKHNKHSDQEPLYTVSEAVTVAGGMELRAGDQFRVLLQDGEYALIERLMDEEHHIVPVSLLNRISDCSLA